MTSPATLALQPRRPIDCIGKANLAATRASPISSREQPPLAAVRSKLTRVLAKKSKDGRRLFVHRAWLRFVGLNPLLD
jgi:hypothetical protein